MDIPDIQAINRATEAKIAARQPGDPDFAPEAVPYYGYVRLDRFECPPFVMFTNNDSPVVTHYLCSGTFEPQSLRLWCRLARAASGIVDIGANVGIYSLCAAKMRPDLPVHAFEPNPYAFARLRLNKYINELPNIVEHAEAIGMNDGIAGFGWHVKPGGNISSGAGFGGYGMEQTEKAAVRTVVLDHSGIAETLGERALIKIDVEGAESIVFNAMRNVIARKPDIILETFDRKNCDEINRSLLPLGYRVYLINEHTSQLEPRDALQPASVQASHNNFNQFITTRPAADIDALMKW